MGPALISLGHSLSSWLLGACLCHYYDHMWTSYGTPEGEELP